MMYINASDLVYLLPKVPPFCSDICDHRIITDDNNLLLES